MDGTNRSLTPIISEEEFLPHVQEKCQPLMAALSVLGRENMTVNKLYYFTLVHEAEKLEVFLDDHGARSNMRWLFLSELVACVRNLALAAFHLYHILDRYSDYLMGDSDQLRREFEDNANKTLNYFSSTLLNFHRALLQEAQEQGIKVAAGPMSAGDWNINVIPQLPYTITSEGAANEAERLIGIAQAYRKVAKLFRQHRLDRRFKAPSLGEIIPSKMNETMFADLETRLHNIQSEYDTYIKGGRVGREDNRAATLRGLTSIPMHLFDFLRWMAHFYERHESDVKKGGVKSKIAALAPEEQLMGVMLNFALRFAGKYLNEGMKVAERILSSFVTPILHELPIPKPQGFHARPATYVSLIVQEHGTDVFMIVNGERYDCRSVLELLQAGGIIADLGVDTVFFEGDKRAVDDLIILAENNYCEDRDVPPELSYLKILRNL